MGAWCFVLLGEYDGVIKGRGDSTRARLDCWIVGIEYCLLGLGYWLGYWLVATRDYWI